ncbi:MAG: DUF1190 domain-containing protein [Proteobacteria bacterium]|nr:DUF1190 domain-containing protein [Pseudomonadota bacterium]
MSTKSDPEKTGASKRSRIVTLSLMGAGAGAIALIELWPSSAEVPADAFQNVESCINSGRYDKSTCERAFAEAARHHTEMAPRYASATDCEADFTPGGCAPLATTAGTTTQSYAPVMAGLLLGGALGAGAAAALPPVQPLYRSCTASVGDGCTTGSGSVSGGGLYTCSGYRVGTSYGTARVQPAAFSTARAGTTTLSRGGFGARASAMSAAS